MEIRLTLVVKHPLLRLLATKPATIMRPRKSREWTVLFSIAHARASLICTQTQIRSDVMYLQVQSTEASELHEDT